MAKIYSNKKREVIESKFKKGESVKYLGNYFVVRVAENGLVVMDKRGCSNGFLIVEEAQLGAT